MNAASRVGDCLIGRSAMVGAIAAALVAMTPAGVGAAERAWVGGDGSWSDPSHWTALPAGSNTVRIAGSQPLTITFNADATIAGITFASPAAIHLTGDATLTLAGGGTIAKLAADKNANHVIATPICLGGDATFSNDGKWVRLANQLEIQSPLEGTGTLTITGKADGGVALRADNRAGFRGQIVVQGGMLVVGHAGALGDVSQPTRLEGGKVMFDKSSSNAEPFVVAGKVSWDSMGQVELSGPIRFEPGATLSLDDDHANGLIFRGILTGPADATLATTAGNITLGGSDANDFAGTLRHAATAANPSRNTLYLDKPAGVCAIAGPLELHRQSAVAWKADDQIADDVDVLLAGGTLRPGGHRDRMGALTLAGRAAIDFEGGGALQFADSRRMDWKPGSQLLIHGWSSQPLGFGGDGAGLTPQQVGMIGFVDPAGKAPGLYRAVLQDDGRLIPGDTVVVPVNPPFAVDPQADAERARLYEVEGLTALSGEKTALKPGMTISFFGDSITWQKHYVNRIDNALKQGAGTAGFGIRLVNHGINGGGALQVLEGTPADANGKGGHRPFAEIIAADKTDIAVVFVGINDVWWRKTTPEDFRQQLTDIAAAAAAQGTRLVMATMAVQGEKPDGTNPNDPKIEQYTQITREVAADAGVVLVDLRKAFIAYNQNHNRELQLDGSFLFRSQGLLTGDGVHPTTKGNEILANLIAQGIQHAAAR